VELIRIDSVGHGDVGARYPRCHTGKHHLSLEID
jgi:hypothetical protein